MLEKNKIKIILYLTVILLVVSAFLSLINRNHEFLYYTIILAIILPIVASYYRRLQIDSRILFGLLVLGAAHLLGGNINIRGTRLYDLCLIKGLIMYDNVIHFTAMLVITFILYKLLRKISSPKADKRLLFVILVLMALGVGVLNELLELFAVIAFNANGVGGYLNNALDLLFNFLGSVTAVVIILRQHIGGDSKSK